MLLTFRPLLAMLAVATFAATPGVAIAAAPPSLVGEQLSTDVHQGATVVLPACDPAADQFAGPFSASGTATGPYTGTYTATGTVTQTANGPAFTESFTITASDGTVITGTKSFPGSDTTLYGNQCASGLFNIEADYSATIATSSGVFRDQGLSNVVLGPGPGDLGFAESFDTGLPGGPVPALPTSKDQCKNGGWKTYGVFKNQGDCISYVATKGKNHPG